jgi:undecaprenyl-diphosphatase
LTLLDAAILGLVEGLTEFLPVSSTGHLIIAGHLLGLAPGDAVAKTFEIVVQLGAIAAVGVLYAQTLWRHMAVVWRLAAAFLPTAVVGFVVYKGVKALLGNADIVAWSLLIGGVFILLFEGLGRRRFATRPVAGLDKLTYWQAAGIGLCQTIAMVPGVSRSAATVLGGLALGLDRRTAVDFSFLLAVPTMLAAAAYDLFKSRHELDFTAAAGPMLLGSVVAFVTALIVVKWLLRYVQNHDFRVFGWYRIGAAVVYWLVIR